MNGSYITVNNKRFFLRSGGKGVPVVLLHGFGEDGEIWRYQWEALAKQYQVLVPDLPGSGVSDPIEDMSMEGNAAWVRALVQTVLPNQNEPKRIILIGHSMGGYITLAFAEKYPSLLNGFGLFHSTAMADTDEKKQARRKSIGFIRAHGSGPFIAQSVPNLFGSRFRTENAAAVDDCIERYSRLSPDTLIAWYEAMIQRPNRESVLKMAGCPVLFIAGREDKAVTFADIVKQCHLPAVSDVYVLESAGHMGMFEEKEKSLAALEQFLHTVTLPALS